jgi:hypothetical protein
MVAVITAVLAGSTAALAAVLVFDHSLAWERSVSEPLGSGGD